MQPAELEALAKALGIVVSIITIAKVGPPLVGWYRKRRRRRLEREEQWAEMLSAMRAFPSSLDTLHSEIRSVRELASSYDGKSISASIAYLQAEIAIERMARRSTSALATYDLRVDPMTGRLFDIHVSASYKHLTGLDAADVTDGGWVRCVHPKDSDRVMRLADDALQREQAFIAHYTLVNVLTLRTFEVEHRGQPVRVPGNDNIVGWVGIIIPRTAPPDFIDAEEE